MSSSPKRTNIDSIAVDYYRTYQVDCSFKTKSVIISSLKRISTESDEPFLCIYRGKRIFSIYNFISKKKEKFYLICISKCGTNFLGDNYGLVRRKEALESYIYDFLDHLYEDRPDEMQRAMTGIDPIVKSYTYESHRTNNKYLNDAMNNDEVLCLLHNVPPQIYRTIEMQLNEISFVREDSIRKDNISKEY